MREVKTARRELKEEEEEKSKERGKSERKMDTDDGVK